MAFDHRVIHWLARWETPAVKAIAAMITRAHQAGKGTPGLTIDMHRWYAIITAGTGETSVIGVQGRDGLGLYDSKEEWEQANG